MQFAFNAGIGPDGKTWGVMVIITGPTTFQMAMPPDVLSNIAENMPAQLLELNAHVRRANLGLVIKTDLNGVKPRDHHDRP